MSCEFQLKFWKKNTKFFFIVLISSGNNWKAWLGFGGPPVIQNGWRWWGLLSPLFFYILMKMHRYFWSYILSFFYTFYITWFSLVLILLKLSFGCTLWTTTEETETEKREAIRAITSNIYSSAFFFFFITWTHGLCVESTLWLHSLPSSIDWWNQVQLLHVICCV